MLEKVLAFILIMLPVAMFLAHLVGPFLVDAVELGGYLLRSIGWILIELLDGVLDWAAEEAG